VFVLKWVIGGGQGFSEDCDFQWLSVGEFTDSDEFSEEEEVKVPEV